MIYTVTTNPNIDYYMDLRAPLRVGGINRSGRELLAPGGKGINVSLMLQTLGKPSCVLGYLAGPTGRLLEALMERHRLRLPLVLAAKRPDAHQHQDQHQPRNGLQRLRPRAWAGRH
ncbi:MAG: hypothetical protein ACLUN5_12430 [Oscillospiraceae bacterium]